MGKRGSVKQVEANRRNAQRSTGPTTVAGKRAVRWNAIKHGLLARTAVIPRSGENKAEFQRLLAGLVESLQPVGILEGLLVDEIASVSWRRRRATRAETGEIEHQLAWARNAWELTQAEVLEEPRAAQDVAALQVTAAGLQMLIEIFDGVATEIRNDGRLSAESVAWLEAGWE